MISAATSQPAHAGRSSPRPLTPKQRKKPHCKQCGKPMQGHRRGRCDTEDDNDSDETVNAKDEDGLVAQLSSIDLKAETTCGPGTKAVRFKSEEISGVLAPAITSMPEELMSLASEDKVMLQALKKPGMLSDDVTSVEGKEKMERLGDWLDSIDTSRRSHRGRPSAPPNLPSRNFFGGVLDINLPRARSTSPDKDKLKSAVRLQKSSSVAEREEFLAEVASRSKKDVTNVYRVDVQEMQVMEERARRLKLHARALAPRFTDGSTGAGWLVIGKDKADVERSFKAVEKEAKGSSNLLSTLGTLATGAVACWMYLAFS